MIAAMVAPFGPRSIVRTVSCFDDAGAATFLDAGTVVGRLVAFEVPGVLRAEGWRVDADFEVVFGLGLVVAMLVSC
jgi:hypothetical protein